LALGAGVRGMRCDSNPSKHAKFPVFSLLAGNFQTRAEFALDCVHQPDPIVTRDVSLLGFLIRCRSNDNEPGRAGRGRGFGSRSLIRSAVPTSARYPRGSQKAMNIIEKHACVVEERIAAGARLKHRPGRIEVGTFPALQIGVGVRMFAVDGTRIRRFARVVATGAGRRAACCGETWDRLACIPPVKPVEQEQPIQNGL